MDGPKTEEEEDSLAAMRKLMEGLRDLADDIDDVLEPSITVQKI